MKTDKILATVSFQSYKSYVLPLEEAQKIQSIIAKHVVGVADNLYDIRHKGHSCYLVTEASAPDVRVIGRSDMESYIDATMLSDKEATAWKETHKNNYHDDHDDGYAEVMDPKLWQEVRGRE